MKKGNGEPTDRFDTAQFLNGESVRMEEEKIELIPLDRISPNPFQPRKVFRKLALEELAADIASKGVTNPVIVRPLDGKNDEFQLCAGERRLRASSLAGLSHIPAVIREYTDIQMRTIANTENTQREDLLFMEMMESFMNLKVDLGNPAEVAVHVNKDPKTVGNYLRIHDAIYSHPAFKKIFEAQMITISFTAAKKFADVAAALIRMEKSNKREFNRIIKRMEKDGIANIVDWIVVKVSDKQRKEARAVNTNNYAKEVEAKANVSLTIRLPKASIPVIDRDGVRKSFERFMAKMELYWEGASQSPMKE